MITRSIRIILLFSILGSCKRSSTFNRAIGCTDKTLCWNQKEHLCLPCEQSSTDSSNDGSDDNSNSNSNLSSNSSEEGPNRMIFDQPFIGSGKEQRWPRKIGGRHSLPPARTSFKNRIGPAGRDWTNDKDVGRNPLRQNRKKDAKRLGLALKDRNDYDGCLDCLPKKNRTSGQDKGDCKEQGMCYLYITGKCIACKEFVLEFAIALDMLMASKSGKQ